VAVRGGNEAVHLFGISDICTDRHGTVVAELSHKRFSRLATVEIVHNYSGTLAGKRSGYGKAKASSCAGDDNDLFRNFHERTFLSWLW
jgi:hypothetical protein